MCGCGGARTCFSGPDRMLGVPGTFTYRRCGTCRTVFQDPRVVREDTALLYPSGYYTRSAASRVAAPPIRGSGGTGTRARIRREIQALVTGQGSDIPVSLAGRMGARSRWIRERAFLDLVPDEMLPWRGPAGRALDVGCGNGDLMLRLEAVGWTCQGLEMDAAAAEVARERTRGEVHVGDVASLDPDATGRFDLVVLSHVFEHLPEPKEALAALKGLLAATGRLVLLYPNPESLGARTFGRHWFAWDAPRHLVLPPLRAVLALGRELGLDCRTARTLARWSADHAKHSRAYRRGEGPLHQEPDLVDRAFGLLERAVLAFGREAGEELLLVFEPRN